MTLAARPDFLAKLQYERSSHRIRPVVIHTWLKGDGYHPLCQVKAVRVYLHAACNTN